MLQCKIIHRVNLENKNKNQRRAIRREFEPVGPIMLKNPLSAGWDLLPTLHGWALVEFREIIILINV